MTFAFVTATNSRTVLESNLLRSPDVSSIPVITKEGYRSASIAYNKAIDESKDDVLVFLHQDIYLPEGWIDKVKEAIDRLDRSDPNWAVLGVLGIDRKGAVAGTTYSTGLGKVVGQKLSTPKAVQSLDEIVLILRKDSGIRFDPHLDGFHMYGTDLCQTAWAMNRSCFAIDAFCVHNSTGIRILPPEFWQAYHYLARKWEKKCPIHSPCIEVSTKRLKQIRQRFRDLKRHILRFSTPNKRVENPVSLYESIISAGNLEPSS